MKHFNIFNPTVHRALSIVNRLSASCTVHPKNPTVHRASCTVNQPHKNINCFPDGRPTVEKDLAEPYYHLLPTFTRIAEAV